MPVYNANKKLTIFAGNRKIKETCVSDKPIYTSTSSIDITYVVDTDVSYIENISTNAFLSPTSFTPTKEGYTFIGWKQDTTADTNVLTTLNTSGSVTLYAVFSKDITISYDGNNGTGSIDPETGTIYYNNGNVTGVSLTLPANSFTYSSGTFYKWAVGSVSGTMYDVGSTVEVSNDTVIYAKWTASKTVSGKALSKSGTFQDGYSASTTVSFGVTFLEPPTGSAYLSGTGWFTDHNHGGSGSISNITTTTATVSINVWENTGNNYNYGVFVQWSVTGNIIV